MRAGGADNHCDVGDSGGAETSLDCMREYGLSRIRTGWSPDNIGFRELLRRRGYPETVWGWRDDPFSVHDTATKKELQDVREHYHWLKGGRDPMHKWRGSSVAQCIWGCSESART